MLIDLQTIKASSRHIVTFAKAELNAILSVYSFQVSKGGWRDYAIDFKKDLAAFSMYRHAHEQPIAAIMKLPANTASGFVFEVFYERKRLGRTPDLAKALHALQTRI